MAVIGAIGLIAALTTGYIAAARHRAIEAFTVSQQARAQAAADAAANAAVFELLAAPANGDRAIEGAGRADPTARCISADGVGVIVAVSNESGRIDLNTAQPELIAALMKGVVEGEGPYRAVARDIVRFRSAAQDRKAQPTFETALQLGRISGLDRRLVQTLLPFVTVHSGSPGLNARLAPAGLLNILAGRSSPNEAQRQNTAFFLADKPGRTARISVTSATGAGLVAARVAIVEFSSDPLRTYFIREWREGTTSPVPLPGRDWPAC